MNRERWWSWNADRPAEMRHLPSGFIITPVLYAASENRTTHLPPGENVVFGHRPIGDREIRLGVSLAGTRLAWRYGMGEAGRLTLDWRTEAFGEWGLRFWVVVCVHAEQGASLAYDPESGVLSGPSGKHTIHIQPAKAPLLATFHDDLAALEAELEDRGYFYLGSRGVKGRFAALRFNLEEAPEMHVEITLAGPEAKGPLDRAPEAPGTEPSKPSKPSELGELGEPGETQSALEALHDVVSWNHVYDFVNERPYTALSRFWNSRKFGGFGVWLDDVLYNAWLWSHFESGRALDNLDAVFAGQTEAGNFPCLVTGNDAWLDRSQPPVASFVVWSLYARSGRRDVLERYYGGLLRNFEWWWKRRRLADTGLLAFGTSPEAGDGLYKGTKLAAKNESTMDNSPLHDPVPFDKESGLLLAADVGLNSLVALDGEILAAMAAELGFAGEQEMLRVRVEAHKERIATWLWDAERQVFANRMPDGRFVAPIAPTSLFPLVAGIGSDEQVSALVDGYLVAGDKFGGDFGLPSVTRDDPAYGDNVYWRGRVWAPLNFWVYQGLRRCGRSAAAGRLAEQSRRLFGIGWAERECGENYNAETGAIHDQPDTDGFYSWGALLPALSVAEGMDFTPWAGWTLAPQRENGSLGPFLTPVGPCFLRTGDHSWRLQHKDGRVLLESNIDGRLTDLCLGSKPSVLLPRVNSADAWISFPESAATRCRLGGSVLDARAGRFEIPAGGDPVRLETEG